MFTIGVRISLVIFCATKFSNLSENSARFSSLSVMPAAYICPPKFSSRSEQLSIAS